MELFTNYTETIENQDGIQYMEYYREYLFNKEETLLDVKLTDY